MWYQALKPRTTKLSGTVCHRACSQPPRPNIGRILRRKILLWLPQDLLALCCEPFFPYLTLFFSQWIWPEYHVVEQGTSLLQYELNGFRRGTSNAWLTQRKRSAILSLAWTIVCACRMCLFTQATKHDTASSAAALRLTRKHGDKTRSVGRAQRLDLIGELLSSSRFTQFQYLNISLYSLLFHMRRRMASKSPSYSPVLLSVLLDRTF